MSTPEPAPILLADTDTWNDLRLFLTRAKAASHLGHAWMVGYDQVLTCTVRPVAQHNEATIMRAFHTKPGCHVDVVAPLAAWTDRLARDPGECALHIPPVLSPPLPWTGQRPPRTGWQTVGSVSTATTTGANTQVPAGLLAAAETMGLLADPLEELTLSQVGRWSRLSGRAGHGLHHESSGLGLTPSRQRP